MLMFCASLRPPDVRGLRLRQDLQGSGQAGVSHDLGALVGMSEFPVPAKRGAREPLLRLHPGPPGSVPGAVEGRGGEPERLD